MSFMVLLIQVNSKNNSFLEAIVDIINKILKSNNIFFCRYEQRSILIDS